MKHTIPVIKSHIIYRMIEQCAILVDIGQKSCHRCNKYGTFIFKHIDGKRRIDDIVQLLRQSYDVTKKDAKISCNRFLEILARRNVIVWKNKASS